MKIIEFQAENIKKLKVVQIKPKGHVIELTGRNGSGKTSVLDSILYALAGTEDLPSQPIRKGTDKGGIFIDLGDYRVLRKFTPNGNVLIVEGKKGERFQKPQQLLDKLFGDLSFDPLAFTRMKPKEQAAELQRLSRLDVDPTAIDAANKEDYDARTQVNREVKQLQAQIDAISFVKELPEQPIDISRLLGMMTTASEENTKLAEQRLQLARRHDALNKHRDEVMNMIVEAEELETRARELREKAELKRKAIEEDAKEIKAVVIGQPFDVSALQEEIENARATNSQIDKRTQKERLQQQLEAKQAEADRLTESMKNRETTKEEAIARAEMPIEGLGFKDGEVTYNDLPLNQASGAEQLRVSLAIAMASNPQVRIIRITDGSLLDDESMEIVKQMAIARDYQIWIEVVDTSGKVGIVMEDGEVIANNDTEDLPAEPAVAEVAETEGGKKKPGKASKAK
jgi:ABC-type polar amino acid transport system ATPase subunit